MTAKYILALDQGTTSSRAILFGKQGKPIACAQQEFPQLFPKPGWVEHAPYAILESQLSAAKQAIDAGGADAKSIAGIGITNQRETTLVWEKATGKPVFNAIVWQCRRTAPLCTLLKDRGWDKAIAEKTGLVIDAYFSATKLQWLLDNVDGLRRRAEKGAVLFGTVDSWLIYNLTGRHVTDFSNASRTMLFNIHTGQWDEDILKELRIPSMMLPDVVCSSGIIGTVKKEIFSSPLPVCGVAGDQQAALFGQGCFREGDVKNTYGTGCFALLNTGRKAVKSTNNLLTTIAWNINHETTYALEGSVFVAGAVIQWLRDGLQLIGSAAETAEIAQSVADTGGVTFVPAFVGLGAPYWDSEARGLLSGLSRGTSKAHIVRAALESIAFQTYDLFAAMEKDLGSGISSLKADGGASANDFLMQFQADLLGIPIYRPVVLETTALGAAFLAGLAVGIWDTHEEIRTLLSTERIFSPVLTHEKRRQMLKEWQFAIQKTCLKNNQEK